MRMLTLVLGTLLVGGCSHTTTARTDTAWEKTKDAFGDAYAAVKSGARDVAHSGDVVFERTKHGAVRVMDRTRSSTARVADDSWITTRVKSIYAVDPVVPATKVHVKTDRGMVVLRGVVDDEAQAQQAIQKALEVPGVVAVTSELAWPEHREAKTYTPRM